MNEITQIHLGRQAFTIAVNAHKLLRDYLAAVKKHMGGSDEGVEEVELRMAELLIERGITGDKVVLASDVEFLKQQLGEPKDFDDDDSDDAEDPKPAENESGTRRLFRDTEHGMVAGVAAGLANYFNIDAVIVRILFVAVTLAGGWGVPIYIVLWLLVPEAKTSSDTLKMRGKAVTVDSLKDLVDRADVPGATHRVRSVAGRAIQAVGKALLTVVGIGVIAAGAMLLFLLAAGVIYMVRHGGTVFQENFFPIGTNETLLAASGLFTVGIIAILLLLTGVAMAKRRWQVPGWGVAALFGLLILGLASTAALAADVVPEMRSRYQAAHHSVTRTVDPFTSVSITGEDTEFVYRHSDTYSVELRYLGNPNTKPVKTEVKDGVLTIDTERFATDEDCSGWCTWFDNYDLQVVIRAPELPQDAVDKLDTTMVIIPAKPAHPYERYR